MIVNTYEMIDLRDWIKVLHINTPSSEEICAYSSKIKGTLWFGRCIFDFYKNSANFCPIFKNEMSKSKGLIYPKHKKV